MGAGLFQPGHLLVILVIALLLFGPGKLPELGSALGHGLRELKRGLNENSDDGQPSAPAAPLRATAQACSHCNAAASSDACYCTSCGRPLGPA